MCPPAIIPAVIAVGTMAAATAASVVSNNKIAKQQAQASKAQAQAVQTVNSVDRNVTHAVEKTASHLRENQRNKRTISSLRIPLKASSTSTTGINTGDVSQTGLNIPM